MQTCISGLFSCLAQLRSQFFTPGLGGTNALRSVLQPTLLMKNTHR